MAHGWHTSRCGLSENVVPGCARLPARAGVGGWGVLSGRRSGAAVRRERRWTFTSWWTFQRFYRRSLTGSRAGLPDHASSPFTSGGCDLNPAGYGRLCAWLQLGSISPREPEGTCSRFNASRWSAPRSAGIWCRLDHRRVRRSESMTNLDGQVAVVTVAASGIGLTLIDQRSRLDLLGGFGRPGKGLIEIRKVVGGPGFEPGASRSRTVRAAELRQPPTRASEFYPAADPGVERLVGATVISVGISITVAVASAITVPSPNRRIAPLA